MSDELKMRQNEADLNRTQIWGKIEELEKKYKLSVLNEASVNGIIKEIAELRDKDADNSPIFIEINGRIFGLNEQLTELKERFEMYRVINNVDIRNSKEVLRELINIDKDWVAHDDREQYKELLAKLDGPRDQTESKHFMNICNKCTSVMDYRKGFWICSKCEETEKKEGEEWDCSKCKFYYTNMELKNELCYFEWNAAEEGFCLRYEPKEASGGELSVDNGFESRKVAGFPSDDHQTDSKPPEPSSNRQTVKDCTTCDEVGECDVPRTECPFIKPPNHYSEGDKENVNYLIKERDSERFNPKNLSENRIRTKEQLERLEGVPFEDDDHPDSKKEWVNWKGSVDSSKPPEPITEISLDGETIYNKKMLEKLGWKLMKREKIEFWRKELLNKTDEVLKSMREVLGIE